MMAHPQILRHHLWQTLETLLDGPTQTVVVEGVDGIGKTTLLRQFLQANEQRTFALFVKPSSTWAYDPFHLGLDLALQISQRLRGIELTEGEIADQRKTYGRFLTQLDRQAKRDRKPFYIIIDGLEDIPADDLLSRSELIGLLPFGFEGLRFLLTGDINALPLNEEARRTAKSWFVPFFTLEESGRFLRGYSLNDEQLQAVYSATRGVPGYLASIWRRLRAGVSTHELVKSLPQAMQDSFALEWRMVQRISSEARLALAVIAFERNSASLETLSRVVKSEPERLASELRTLSFVGQNPDSSYQFATEAFRRFAANQLQELRPSVADLAIEVLMADPDSDDALSELPGLYSRAGRFAEVLDYLSPDRFVLLFQRSPSLRMVKDKADEGIAAARALKRDGDLLRFTLQRSAVEEIALSDVGVAEVRARSALGDFENAIGLANGVRRTDLRLRLLAAIARVRRDRGLPEDEELSAQVRSLYGQIDPTVFKDTLTSTASDLFAIAPDLATELLSKATGVEGENAIDWALARLSVQALVSTPDAQAKEKARELRDRIQDPTARKLSMELGIILGGRSAREAIEEAERLESAGDRLYILQKWMWSNRERRDAKEVLEQGVRLALQATGYTANAQVFRELAGCLPYLDDIQAVSYYVSIIDGQRGELERIGPAEEFIRLQLILARAEWKHDRVAGRSRFADVYYAIGRIKEAVTRTASLARMTASLARTDPDREMEREDSLHSLLKEELYEGVDALLAASAEQFEACRGVVQALAVACPDAALEVIEKINTEPRRDRGYVTFVDAAIGGPLNEIKPDVILRAIGAMVDPEVRDEAISSVVGALRRRQLTATDATRLVKLCELATTMYAARLRALSCVQLASVLRRISEDAVAIGSEIQDLTATLLRAGRTAWDSSDEDWQKLDLAFDIIVALAGGASEHASEYVDEANRLKRRLVIADSETARAGSLTLRLAIRAYAGLAAKDLVLQPQKDRLLAAIRQVGSVYDQAMLLAELAVRCYLVGRKGDCEALVQKELVPLIYSVPEAGSEQHNEIVVETAPALYVGASATALGLINSLPNPIRDQALGGVATFLLRKTSPWDPYDKRENVGYDITFEDTNRLLTIMREMQEDWRIYYLLKDIATSASSRTYGINFKHGQRADLVRQLEVIAREKFPTQRFIRHDGYRIVAQAQINRLRQASEQVATQDLAAQARTITNAADQAHILAVVAATARHAKDRQLLIAEARTVIDALPSLGERLDHYQTLSVQLLDVDERQSKELLRQAVQLSLTGEGDSITERRHSLVELVCHHFPDVTASLASMTDDDPAKQRIERQVRLHKIKEAIAPRRSGGDAVDVGNLLEWSKASWMKLGSLVAGRLAPANPARGLPMLEHAGRQPISHSYPIVAWFIENAIRFQKGTEATREYVGPLFGACLLGAELASRATARAGGLLRQLEVAEKPSQSALIEDGERARGLEFIKEWLIENSPKQLWIVEPYFAPESVEALALINDACEDCEVMVLTGLQNSLPDRNDAIGESYVKAWRRIRSDEPPPTTLIFVQGRTSKKFPIHDRWWLSENAGLGLGTSYNGIGARVSEIRKLTREDTASRILDFTPYFTLVKKEYSGERLEYRSHSL